MELYKKYFDIIIYSIIGIIFSFASFYLILNFYHYFEVRKAYNVDFNDYAVLRSIDNNIGEIEENLSYFDENTYKGKMSSDFMLQARSKIKACISDIRSNTFNSIILKNKLTSIDLYNLINDYENSVVGDCLNINLLFLYSDKMNDSSLYNNPYYIYDNIDYLRGDLYYVKKELLNNSSYYFNSNSSSRINKNYPKDGFDQVFITYNKVTNLLLNISKWYKAESIQNVGDNGA